MRRKTYGLLTVGLLFSLLLTSSSLADDSQVLLTKAVEKLIVDVHNLKLKVMELENELNEMKQRKDGNPVLNETKRKKDENTVLSRTSCVLATVKEVNDRNKEWVLSNVPEEAPVYDKKWKNYYVFLTLPSHCLKVKERIKDAFVSRIPIASDDDRLR